MHKVFRPTPADIVSMKIETLEGHCVVITGRGVVWIDGEYVEFWQIQKTRGKSFAENGGFTRFERHKGLIQEVYEFVQQTIGIWKLSFSFLDTYRLGLNVFFFIFFFWMRDM